MVDKLTREAQDRRKVLSGVKWRWSREDSIVLISDIHVFYVRDILVLTFKEDGGIDIVEACRMLKLWPERETHVGVKWEKGISIPMRRKKTSMVCIRKPCHKQRIRHCSKYTVLIGVRDWVCGRWWRTIWGKARRGFSNIKGRDLRVWLHFGEQQWISVLALVHMCFTLFSNMKSILLGCIGSRNQNMTLVKIDDQEVPWCNYVIKLIIYNI